MTLGKIYNDFIDNDKKVLKACFEADKDLANVIQKLVTKEISAIWYALISKGVVTEEEMTEFHKEIEKEAENDK